MTSEGLGARAAGHTGTDTHHPSRSPGKARQSSTSNPAAAAASHAHQPPEFKFRSQAFDQAPTAAAQGSSSSSASAEAGVSTAFAELDANQDPIQRLRFPAAAKDARSMADQGNKQHATAAAGGDAGAAPAVWASFLSGFQQQAYVSPGARAGGRRAAQRKGATPRASRMQQQQQQPMATGGFGAGGAGNAAAPMFAFGSPMQPDGNAGPAAAAAAAGPAQPAGSTPAPSTLPPGSAMSLDTGLPATFTAAFSAMSVDATPAAGASGSSEQAWAFRGPRAAAVTGKRLFDTPSTAGGDASSTPSPFGGSWGRAAGAQQGSGDGGSSSGAGRGGAEPVPFPGFGGAGQEGTGSPAAGGTAFNPGKPSPTPGRRARQQRSSPATKAQSAHAFGGFGSPAFGKPPAGAGNAAGTLGAFFAVAGAGSSSGSTPGMSSGASFQGFFGGRPPGSAGSTPGFSPMMWSPADPQDSGASPPPPFGAAAAAPAAAGAGFSFGAVDGRQQSAAALAQEADARLRQAQQQLSQQQQQQQQAVAAEAASAAAVDLPSDDSTESIAELLTDLRASGSRPVQAGAETEAVAGLRQAVEQLSTGDKPPAAQAAAQQQVQQPAQHAGTQQQQEEAAPSFMFGSPLGASLARSGSEWLSSPAAPGGAVPTTLFDMSPLKASLDAAAAAGPAAGSAAQPPIFGAPAVGSAAAPAPAAAASSGTAPGAAANFGPAGGFSFTPGKASGTPGKAAARGKKHTPAKQPKPPAAAAAEAATDSQASLGVPGASAWGTAAAAAAAAAFGAGDAPQQAQATSSFRRPQQQAEQQPPQQQSSVFDSSSNPFAPQQQQHASAAGTSMPIPGRRKVHATPRRAKPAGAQQQGGGAPAWPPAAVQQPWAAAAAAAAPPANISFTVGSSKAAGAGTPVRSPRKGRAGPQQQPEQQDAASQADAELLQALREADVWTQRAQASFAAKNWAQADAEFQQGMEVLKRFRDADKACEKLSDMHTYRAAVRIGGDDPEGALKDGLEAIRARRKNIEAYLRTATCLSKLGCLTAADRVLDKVLDMISANHKDWSKLNLKRHQVSQLAAQQQRVVATALGCDSADAAAALAHLSAGAPVQHLIEGLVSVSVRQGAPAAAAAAALAEAGTGPLEAAPGEQLVSDAKQLVRELGFWEDSAPLLAWLLVRSGQLSAAASVAEAQPNGFFTRQQRQHSGGHWGWRWWVLAQVRWHQGDLGEAKALMQQGLEQLRKLQAQQDGSSSGGGGRQGALWRLLLPSLQELEELLVQTQQLLSFKEAGNAAIQAKQYDKAAEAYTKALALQPSCGFAAVIHSNRAAALQQQQRLVEALADCSRAVALDPKYARAYLRMAQVLESLHRADRAVVVLQDALKGPANAVDPATTRGHELTHGANMLQLTPADRRKFEDMLATAQVAARRFKTPHHYKALGLAMSATEGDIRKAYRALALKHHPDKALQHCRWAAKPGRCGAAVAHMTASAGGVEASLKAAANEVFGFLSAAHEELTNAASRSKLDRGLRTEEQLWSSSSGTSGYSRPASYTYSYGGRRADADYGFDDFFRRTAAAGGSGRTYQQQQQQQQPRQQQAGAGSSRAGGSGGGGGGRPGGGGGAGNRWYENDYWAAEELESDEDEYDYGGSGYHYRSKY